MPRPKRHELVAGKLVGLIQERGIGVGDRIPTTRELERLFGVARKTVTRAIRQLIDEGLLRSRRGSGCFLARSPAHTAAGTVSLLFGKGLGIFHDPIWAEPHEAILESLQRGRHETTVHALNKEFNRDAYLARLRDRRWSGLIMTANVNESISAAAGVLMSVVGVQDTPLELDILWSCCDNAAALEMAVEHLVRLGHRRIAHAASLQQMRCGRERLDSQREALARRGLALARRHISGHAKFPETARFYSSGRHNPFWVRSDFLDGADRPTAVICASIGLTNTLRALAREKGLRIPHDLSVIALQDSPEFGVPDETSITVVQTMTRTLGENAVRLLKDAMSGVRPAQRILRAAPEMRLRASTAPPVEKP